MRARLWSVVKRYLFDGVIVLGAAYGIAVVIGIRGEEDAPTAPLWVLVPAMMSIILPLLARRRFPFGAPAAAMVALAAFSFAEGRLVDAWPVTFLAVLAADFLFGLLRDRRQAVAGLAIMLAGASVAASNSPEGGIGDFGWIAITLSIVWLAGFLLGGKLAEAAEAEERAARLEREREEKARQAVAEERARIARELHDVVGHSVSVMTVQAGAVRRLLRPDQEREREALEIVEQTGREALAEMRRLVGVLRRPEEGPALAPQPSLEFLDRLVEQVREAGLPVQLEIQGDAIQLPPGIDLTAYRLVQEGLTNALKHARATRADVLVRYGDRDVEIVVADDGLGEGSGDGGGHGLVGMRERVTVYGGELEAGPRPEGGYALRAQLPIG